MSREPLSRRVRLDALLVEPIGLRDLRDPGQDLDLPFGAVSPRLPAP